ncbi:MAG TPA: hypothetical protein VGD74_05545 [Vulgatibacter sp.]
MTWDELARRHDARPVWIFRGECPGGRSVAWGTSSVTAPGFSGGEFEVIGRVEGRILSVGDITRGIPSAHDGPPERIDTQLVLDNHDRALDWLMIGGPTVASEFTGDSALNLSGKVSLAWVVNGELQELDVTPTLCVAGSPSQVGGLITLPLASRDELLVGKSDKKVTVRDLLEATATRGKMTQGDGEAEFHEWGTLSAKFGEEHLDDEIPWAYGRVPIRLVHVTDQANDGDRVLLAWLSRAEPTISPRDEWEIFSEQYGEAPLSILGTRGGWYAFAVPLELPEIGSFWLTGIAVYRLESKRKALAEGVHYAIPPASSRLGTSSPASPPAIIRQVIADHALAGSAGIDGPSFTSAAAASASTAGAFGGLVTADTDIADALGQLSALGYGLWIDTDDRLHIQALGAWDGTEELSGLPVIRPSDVIQGSWREWLPVQAAERGAAATRTRIEWTREQEEIFREEDRRAWAVGLHRAKLAQEAEATIAGGWIFPPASDVALTGAGARRAYATRRISFVCAAWTAGLRLGQLVRITHPYGLQATGGGYTQRLARVERMEIRPSEMGVTLQLEDLGPLEALRVGRLDSREFWVERIPSTAGSPDLEFKGGNIVRTSKAFFKPTDEGLSLQTWGAPTPGNRRSWRIKTVLSTTEAELTEVAAKAETVDASPPATPLIDQNWILMHNRTSRGWGYRPWAITAADEDVGVFTDGSDGFVMTS